MGWRLSVGLIIGVLVFSVGISNRAKAEVSESSMRDLERINNKGPHLGIIVPNAFEMNPLLQSPSFVADHQLPYLDFSGRRFQFGRVNNENVIIVMTGSSRLNAGRATQLLPSLFKVKGVLHYGIAGNANPQLQIGDVTIPQYWAHAVLWNWHTMKCVYHFIVCDKKKASVYLLPINQFSSNSVSPQGCFHELIQRRPFC